MSQGNLWERFGNGSGGVVPSYQKGNLGEKPVREQSVCLRNGSGSDKGKEEKSLLREVMLSWITQHTNWIELSANQYITLLNSSKLSKISSASDSPIHTVKRMETAPDLFRTNSIERMLGNPTVQSVTEDIRQAQQDMPLSDSADSKTLGSTPREQGQVAMLMMLMIPTG